MQMQRLHIFFSGRVQGVGFRCTCRRIAQQYAALGFVRNLADGRVELVAEGDRPELESFRDQILEVMADNIHDHHQSWETAENCFHQFRIEQQ